MPRRLTVRERFSNNPCAMKRLCIDELYRRGHVIEWGLRQKMRFVWKRRYLKGPREDYTIQEMIVQGLMIRLALTSPETSAWSRHKVWSLFWEAFYQGAAPHLHHLFCGAVHVARLADYIRESPDPETTQKVQEISRQRKGKKRGPLVPPQLYDYSSLIRRGRSWVDKLLEQGRRRIINRLARGERPEEEYRDGFAWWMPRQLQLAALSIMKTKKCERAQSSQPAPRESHDDPSGAALHFMRALDDVAEPERTAFILRRGLGEEPAESYQRAILDEGIAPGEIADESTISKILKVDVINVKRYISLVENRLCLALSEFLFELGDDNDAPDSTDNTGNDKEAEG